jgi:excisionase family DNA binding protein
MQMGKSYFPCYCYDMQRTVANGTCPERLALSVPELAELLGISQRHVWKLVARGVLTPVRLGRSVRFLRVYVLAVLETTGRRNRRARRPWARIERCTFLFAALSAAHQAWFNVAALLVLLMLACICVRQVLMVVGSVWRQTGLAEKSCRRLGGKGSIDAVPPKRRVSQRLGRRERRSSNRAGSRREGDSCRAGWGPEVGRSPGAYAARLTAFGASRLAGGVP